MRLSKIGRKKLFVDQSRRWNLDEPAAGAASKMKTKIRLILFGYMWYDEHVESLLNITGSYSSNGNNSKKNNFLRESSRYLHKTERQNKFYNSQKGNWTVLYPALSTQLILF